MKDLLKHILEQQKKVITVEPETEPTTEPTTTPETPEKPKSPIAPTPGITPNPKAEEKDVELFVRARESRIR
jgi:hypothetical protein